MPLRVATIRRALGVSRHTDLAMPQTKEFRCLSNLERYVIAKPPCLKLTLNEQNNIIYIATKLGQIEITHVLLFEKLAHEKRTL